MGAWLVHERLKMVHLLVKSPLLLRWGTNCYVMHFQTMQEVDPDFMVQQWRKMYKYLLFCCYH